MFGSRRRIAAVFVCAAAATLLANVILPTAEPLASAAPADPAASRAKLVLDKILQEQRESHSRYAASLAPLARQCEAGGFAADAARIRELTPPMDARLIRFRELPTELQPEISGELPEAEKEWRTQLRRLRTNYGKELYLLSRRALKAGYPSYAFQLVQEVLRHDPDHKMARQILGYKQQGRVWATPFTAKMLGQKQVWHDKFGWLPKSYVEKYDAGQRYFRRWMSAEQEAEIRRDFKNAWTVRTEHYLVKTNHSLERGVEIARTLETYHDFFIQTFAGFFSTPEQMQKLFQASGDGSALRATRDPYEVHFYRTREEYLQKLRDKAPNIGITNGLYYTSDRVAYFYFDPDKEKNPDKQRNDALFHEAAHQLFYEAQKQERPIATRENFWIVEGIACYVESYQRESDQAMFGDPRHIRFENARFRYLEDRYYVPLAKFASTGMPDFYADPNIAKNYSQASGLAHFFMHYDGGRYRDALIEHLAQIYRGDEPRRAPAQSLEELTGASYAELDRQYGEHMRQMETSLTQEQAVKPQ